MADMSKEQEAFWRETLSTLRGPFPEVGLEPPKEEVKQEEPTKETIGGFDPDVIGNFSKITMDLYLFTSHETNKSYVMQQQSMIDFGTMPLKKAVEKVKRSQRRNKG